MDPARPSSNALSLLALLQRPYSIPTPLLHCLVVRERHPSGEGPTQYYMYLGEPEHERQEKFLLAASHLSK